jgi:hypothetical protein
MMARRTLERWPAWRAALVCGLVACSMDPNQVAGPVGFPTVVLWRFRFAPLSIALGILLVYLFARLTAQSHRARHGHGHPPRDEALVRIARTARIAGSVTSAVSSRLFIAWERFRKIVLDDPPENIQAAAGAITFGWGVVIAWPRFEVFKQAPSYALLGAWAPEWIWGGAMLFAGLVLLVGVGRERPGLIRSGAFLCWLLWTCVSAGFIVYNWKTTATITCPFFGLLCYWGYYRTPPILVPRRRRWARWFGSRRRDPASVTMTARTEGTPSAPAAPPPGRNGEP